MQQPIKKDYKTSRPYTIITLLSVGHIVNDSYMSMYPALLPFIIPVLGLNISEIGWLATAFAVTSSMSQLVIGYFTDRKGGRFFVFLGPLVAAVFMSSIGLIHNYALMALAVSLAGLGVASFHPPSSSIAGSVDTKNSGRTMSLFVLGGNIGFSLMPLIAVPFVLRFGLSSTPFLAIPGLIIAVFLFFLAPAVNPGRHHEGPSFIDIVKSRPGVFVSLLSTVAFRSLAFSGLTTFLPKFFIDQGFSPLLSGIFLSILTFSGAIGGLIGGFLSDKLGRRPVIMGSLFLAVPFLTLFQLSSNHIIMGFWLFISGAMLLAPFSVTVVAAQEIFPGNRATASSLSMGFGLGLGGLGVGVLGHIASSIGLTHTISLIGFLPLLAGMCAIGLPGKQVLIAELQGES